MVDVMCSKIYFVYINEQTRAADGPSHGHDRYSVLFTRCNIPIPHQKPDTRGKPPFCRVHTRVFRR